MLVGRRAADAVVASGSCHDACMTLEMAGQWPVLRAKSTAASRPPAPHLSLVLRLPFPPPSPPLALVCFRSLSPISRLRLWPSYSRLRCAALVAPSRGLGGQPRLGATRARSSDDGAQVPFVSGSPCVSRPRPAVP